MKVCEERKFDVVKTGHEIYMRFAICDDEKLFVFYKACKIFECGLMAPLGHSDPTLPNVLIICAKTLTVLSNQKLSNLILTFEPV